MNTILLVYVTHPNPDAAKRTAHHLLTKRLVACANLFGVESAYWWQGAITGDAETVCLLKTSPEHKEAVCAAVESIHPYDIPCIAFVTAETNDAFANWVRRETQINP